MAVQTEVSHMYVVESLLKINGISEQDALRKFTVAICTYGSEFQRIK